MSDIGQSTIVGSIKGSDFVLVVIAGKVYRIAASTFFQDSLYQGLALLTTNPDTPARGYWYFCNENGTYTNFGAQVATKNDRFIYNGTTWDHVAFTNLIEEGYKGVVEPAAAAIADPENSWWVRCGSNGTYTNFSNLAANAGDLLIYNTALLAWEKQVGNAGIYTLGQNLAGAGYKGTGFAPGSAAGELATFEQVELKIAKTQIKATLGETVTGNVLDATMAKVLIDKMNYANLYNIPVWLQDKLLFLAHYSNISAGALINELGSNTMSVTGDLGSEYYQLDLIYGEEEVLDPEFNDPTKWWLNSGTIADGVAHFVSLVYNRGVYLVGQLEIGKRYEYSYEIKNYVEGGFVLMSGTGNYGQVRTANGVYTDIFVATGTNLFFHSSVGPTTLDLDNVHGRMILMDDYVITDIDYLWLAADGTSRNKVSSFELVNFDFSRTLVKYENISPFTIVFFGILKSDAVFTADELNALYEILNLSVWWSNALSIYGTIKENRLLAHNVFEELVPDGTFTVGSAWTKDPNITIAYGEGIFNNAIEGGIYRILSTLLEVGEIYIVRYEITQYTSGSVKARISGSYSFQGPYETAVGLYEYEFTHIEGIGGSLGKIELRSSPTGFVGKVDNFSIYKKFKS